MGSVSARHRHSLGHCNGGNGAGLCAATVTTAQGKVHPLKFAVFADVALLQPWPISLHVPPLGVRREETNQRDGIGLDSAHLSSRQPCCRRLLRKAFPVLSNYNTKKEIHLTCK